MNQKSKEVRLRLKMSTRAEFEKLVYDAMLTPTQEEVLRLHIAGGVSVPIIAMRLSISETCVRNYLSEAYEKAAKI
jgi:DNA-binding NarL/FixJ family response regulator